MISVLKFDEICNEELRSIDGGAIVVVPVVKIVIKSGKAKVTVKATAPIPISGNGSSTGDLFQAASQNSNIGWGR